MQFSFKKIFRKIEKLLFTPKAFWEAEKNKTTGEKNLMLVYLLPLIGMVAIAVFIGDFFKRIDFFIEYPLLKALRIVLLFLLTYQIGVFFTTELMKTFGAEKQKDIARKLVAYSITPFLLVSLITGLFPFLYVLSVLGLYGFYLFWQGVDKLLSLPENRKSSYTLITIVTNFFVFSFLSVLLTKLLNAYYG